MAINYSVIYFILIFLAFKHVAVKSESDPDTLHCRDFFTYGYGYNTFFRFSPVDLSKKDLRMFFYVRAKSDAHVLLSVNDNLQPGDIFEPVYEIVLGAGKNTFSDIRRTRRTGSKITVNTPDLLSQHELKGFLIRITDGLIEVFKEGDDSPFMFWMDTRPLPVKFFSFSTWTDVFGRWRFDCNLTQNDSSTIVEKKLTWVDRLKSDLLKGYDAQVIPKSNFSERLEIKVQFDCNHVILDSKTGEITLNGVFGASWSDEKLRWKPDKYSGINILQLGYGEIWRPEFVLYNSVGHGAEPLGVAGLAVNSSGDVTWFPPTNLQARCKLDLSNWPWDQHTCKLLLGFWALKDFLELSIPSNNKTQLTPNQKLTSQWEVISIESYSTWMKTPWHNQQDSDGSSDKDQEVETLPTDSVWVISIMLKRATGIYSYALLMPLIVNSVISLISFGLPPVSPAKIGILCFCLLLNAMFIIAVDSAMPSTVESIPYILKAYSQSMLIIALATVVSVCIMSILRAQHFKPPHPVIQNLLTWNPLKLVLFLPTKHLGGLTNYDELNNQSEGTADEDSSRYYWTLLGCTIDRIALFVTTACLLRALIFS